MAEPPIYAPKAGIAIPQLAHVRQHFDTSRIDDVEAAVRRAFEQVPPETIGPGMRVAITAGSRGIAEIARVIRAAAGEVRRRGGEPFVVTAMGSHGGANVPGQLQVLESYGITPATVGCPIEATMDTVVLGASESGVDVHFDTIAARADGIILLNRVKPHSILTGDLGSGMMKIAGVGLGNHAGAASIHASGLAQHLLPVARIVLAKAPIRMGLALVENARDELWKIEGVAAGDIEAADRRLLREARTLLPNIPFDPIDILIVDQIGKNISGTGMDPNVIGMHRRIGGTPDRRLDRIIALGLSPESHGNANGVGMADIITSRLRDAIDWPITWANALTADFLEGLKLPITCATGRDALALAMRTLDAATARVIRIADTAHLEDMWVSPALLAELGKYPSLEQAGDLEEFEL